MDTTRNVWNRTYFTLTAEEKYMLPFSSKEKCVLKKWRASYEPECQRNVDKCHLKAAQLVVFLVQAGLAEFIQAVFSRCSWLEVARICVACDELSPESPSVFKIVKSNTILLTKICRIERADSSKYDKFSTTLFWAANIAYLQTLSTSEDFLTEFHRHLPCSDSWMIDHLHLSSEKTVAIDIQFNPTLPLVVVQTGVSKFTVYRYGGSFRRSLGALVYAYFEALRSTATLEGLSWSPDGRVLAVFRLSPKNHYYTKKTILLFRYSTASGAMHQLVDLAHPLIVHSCLTTSSMWRGKCEIVAVVSTKTPFPVVNSYSIVRREIVHKTVLGKDQWQRLFGATDETEDHTNLVVGVFSVPHLADLLFFVLGNCPSKHSHDRICVLNTSTSSVERYFAVPGFVKKISCRGTRAAILFAESSKIKFAVRGEASYTGQGVCYQQSTGGGDGCPLREIVPHPKMSTHSPTWRFLLIEDGVALANIDYDRYT